MHQGQAWDHNSQSPHMETEEHDLADGLPWLFSGLIQPRFCPCSQIQRTGPIDAIGSPDHCNGGFDEAAWLIQDYLVEARSGTNCRRSALPVQLL